MDQIEKIPTWKVQVTRNSYFLDELQAFSKFVISSFLSDFYTTISPNKQDKQKLDS